MYLVFVLFVLIALIVLATAKLKLNPFITLLLAAFVAAFAYGLPLRDIEATIQRSVARTLKASPVAMTVALSTGLFATHTLVPPTPGPIAAAGNLGLSDNLGLVILMGLGFALIAAPRPLCAGRLHGALDGGPDGAHLGA
ncbi:MAG: hypothetical protein Q7U82_04655 [Gammaproteobacteria bacterium]|nr:hypothetical protein [Gammaproteobacteria bacterium]